MKFTPFILSAVAVAAASVSLPALAAETTVGVETISCDSSVAQDGQVITNWKTTEEKQARLAILRNALTPKAERATCLIGSGSATLPTVPATAPNGTPILTQTNLIQEILIVLNEDPIANAALIAQILDQYGDQLAEVADDIEPAGGDEEGGPDFTPDTPNDPENPNQLDTPEDDTPPASPVVPVPQNQNL